MKARKRFGQHFLEPAWVDKLVAAIEPAPTDRVLEIGPGRGAITVPLAARVGQLVAVEVDRDLARALQQRALPNVTVVTADVLTVDLSALALDLACTSDRPVPIAVTGGTEGPSSAQREIGVPPSAPRITGGRDAPPSIRSKVRVVGNLPYNISSPILFRLLDVAASTGALQDATLMLQKEVADRLVAKPGTGEYGVLTLTTALGADVSSMLSLPPGAFRPSPQVRSAVVRLTFRSPPSGVHNPRLIVEIVRTVFTQRRKMLSNALALFASSRGRSTQDVLAAAGIDARRRPETLTVAEVARLADQFSGSG